MIRTEICDMFGIEHPILLDKVLFKASTNNALSG